MNEQELLELKQKSDKQYKEDRNFNVWWNAQEPIRKWALEKLKEAFKAMDKGFFNDNIRRVGLDNDHAAAHVISHSGLKCGTPEYNKAMLEATKIYEDENMLITGVIDYDMDTTMLKYTVRSKVSDLWAREAECCP